MPRPLISKFLNHSQSSSASKCNITFEKLLYRMVIICTIHLFKKMEIFMDHWNQLVDGVLNEDILNIQSEFP